ncbi:PH domain-containing protein [Methylobacterium nigriterrae]|uniref:PH domain-containing protein n=1 Tax=Methylobacterium nigriterrae TaxID=3127512 RepID=UPI003D669C35
MVRSADGGRSNRAGGGLEAEAPHDSGLDVLVDLGQSLVNRQGITGRKVEYLTVPYRSIASLYVETAWSFDLDSELKIWIPGRSEPTQRTPGRRADTMSIQQTIAASLRWGIHGAQAAVNRLSARRPRPPRRAEASR